MGSNFARLVWNEDKTQDISITDNLSFLQLDEEKTLKTKNATESQNLIIEGNNFDALCLLQRTHKGKVDLIYIDPPYNTGNKDFIYNDDFVNEVDGDRHSKWLSFMKPRLILARELLSNNGVIFISIDYHEFAHLKLLCDSIFHEKNMVEIFSWVRTETPANLAKQTKVKTEFVLAYQKEKNKEERWIGKYKKKEGTDNAILNSGNTVGVLEFDSSWITWAEDLYGRQFKKGTYKVSKANSIQLLEDFTVGKSKTLKLKGAFKWQQSYLEEQVAAGTKLLIKTENLAPRYDKVSYSPEVPPNLIDSSVGVGTNENGNSEIESLGISFSNPKPVSLIKYLISMVPNAKTVLDFFAGSGTTGQAVLELNKENPESQRNFILVSCAEAISKNAVKKINARIEGLSNGSALPKEGYTKKSEIAELKELIETGQINICRDITALRVMRAACGYKTFEGLGGDFKYFKIQTTQETARKYNKSSFGRKEIQR